MPATDRLCSHTLPLDTEAATARLGAALATVLRPGDTVLLIGQLGAGKSALARAVIATLLENPGAEIPSPSYTLVNVYDTAIGQVWHADLYRLSGEAGEIEELGLDEAIGTAGSSALVLIEWPERLGEALPARRIEVRLSLRGGTAGRDARVELVGPDWDAVAAMLADWT
jgi:tRNA threonylcarbamoyladenosine biosynthesis protein TsaE